MGERVTFRAGAETEAGYLALPSGGAGAGVLVLHAWWGLTPFFEELCDRLARAGFVAFAPDLSAGQTAATIDAAEVLMRSRDATRTEMAAFGGLDYLRGHPGLRGTTVGIIGFSAGAAWAMLFSAARPAQVAAAVVFYGTQLADFGAARASYLLHFAEHDEWEPVEDVRLMEAEMRAAGRDVTLHVYPGAGHWFFEQDRPEHNAPAAALAWQRTLAFLHQHLGR